MIVFSRPSAMGFAVGMEVHVDGKPYGNLRARGRVAVPTSPGDHHVEVVTSQGRSTVTTVSTSSGETTVNVGLAALTGRPKLS